MTNVQFFQDPCNVLRFPAEIGSSDELQVIRSLTKHLFTMNKTKPKKLYKVQVDKQKLEFKNKSVTGQEILAKAGYEYPECFDLYEKLKGCDFERISPDEKVDLSRPGIEKFTVKETEVFEYTLDGEPETTDKKTLTANELLKLGGIKDPQNYYLIEYTSIGSEKKYKGSEKVTMTCPGSEFVSVFDGSTPVAFGETYE